jgi:hypothetical protein
MTKEDAETKKNFIHVKLVDSKGNPVKCRASGKCKTWKTRPNECRLPVKHGLYNSFYLSHHNCEEWIAVS